MCKYCKLELVSEKIGEKTNQNSPDIAKIKDGSQISTVSIYRDIVESTNERSNSMLLELMVEIDSIVYPVKSKVVKIKYCPFCGEEL